MIAALQFLIISGGILTLSMTLLFLTQTYALWRELGLRWPRLGVPRWIREHRYLPVRLPRLSKGEFDVDLF